MATATTTPTILPLHDHVIIRRHDSESVTPGGIVLPDGAKDKPQRGTVLAVGPGKKQDDGTRTPLDVEVGDTILFTKYAGHEFKVDGEEILVLRETDVIARLGNVEAAE